MRRALVAVSLLAAACSTREPTRAVEAKPSSADVAAPVAQAEPAAAVQAAAPSAQAAVRTFGTAPTIEGAPQQVAALLAAPEPHLGKKVKCEGKVARVCQRAGCWLELQAASGGEGLRVPMAGHAFFIPQDAVGQLAVIEGELRRHELPTGQRAHYEGEGMKAVGPLSLDATSVSLTP